MSMIHFGCFRFPWAVVLRSDVPPSQSRVDSDCTRQPWPMDEWYTQLVLYLYVSEIMIWSRDETI